MVNKYLNLVEGKFGKEQPSDTALVLTVEASKVAYALFTAMRHPDSAQCHRAFAKSDMIDVFTQMHILCESMGWDWDELDSMSYEKLVEGVNRER